MGGRGSSSASVKSSKARGKSAESSLKSIDSRMEKLEDTMSKTASGHTSFLQGSPNGSASDHRRYVAAQKEYQHLQAERGRILDEMAKKKQASSSAGKTFVNSFGEATTREITSASYKRWLKRNEREIMSRMKGWR